MGNWIPLATMEVSDEACFYEVFAATPLNRQIYALERRKADLITALVRVDWGALSLETLETVATALAQK